jgi:malonyl CoA-acyl carrier protein transacylase
VPVSALAGHSAGELAAALAGGTMPNERLLGVQFIQIMDMMQRQEDSGDTDVLLLAVGLGRSELTRPDTARGDRGDG